MVSLALLQRIFPTHELNQGLLPFRQILYQLSYQGSRHSGGKGRQLRLVPSERLYLEVPVFNTIEPDENSETQDTPSCHRRESEGLPIACLHTQE